MSVKKSSKFTDHHAPRHLWLALLAAHALAGPAPASGAASKVFWASEPAAPGQVVLLYGGDLARLSRLAVERLDDGDPGEPPGPAAPASGEAVLVPALQPSDGSVKLRLPSDLPAGVFAIRSPGAPAPLWVLGLPRVDWCQPVPAAPGLGANRAAPGSTIQVVGRNFLPDADASGTRAFLRAADGRAVALRVDAVDPYSMTLGLPPTLAAGSYRLWVHNGRGGAHAWGGGLAVDVTPPTRWPERVFDVTRFGARGDGVTDASDALRACLDAAARNGGGVVYWPPGTYRVAGTFRIPPRTTLGGAGMDASRIVWPQTPPRAASDFLPAALTGDSEWAIEGLSLVVRNAAVALRAPGGRDVFLRRIRLHYLPWSGRPTARPEDDPQWAFGRWGITNGTDRDLALAADGVDNLELSDSEIVGSVRLLDGRNVRVAGNTFSNQMASSWTDLGGEHVVVERNRLVGAASFRPGRVPLRRLYVARNGIRTIERGEREAFTFDVNGLFKATARPPAWEGRVVSATATSLSVGAEPAPEARRDADVLVVDGRGTGQLRHVEGGSGTTLTTSPAWDVLPDATSVVLVGRLPGRCVTYGNRAADTSVLFQMWGPLFDCTFDSNEVVRSQGMWGLGGWFVQWIRNRLDVAVSYQPGVGPRGDNPEGNAEYGLLGFTLSGALPLLPIRFPYARAAIVRANRLSDGHRILCMWGYGGARTDAGFVAARDLVVDRNRVERSPVGVELDANVAGALLAGNAFVDVARPLRLAAPGRCLVLDGG
jgi:hypothetical protein